MHAGNVRATGPCGQLSQLHQRILDQWRLEWRHILHTLRRGVVEQRLFGKLLSMCCGPRVVGWRLVVRGLCGGDLRGLDGIHNMHGLLLWLFRLSHGLHQLHGMLHWQGARRHGTGLLRGLRSRNLLLSHGRHHVCRLPGLWHGVHFCSGSERLREMPVWLLQSPK